MTDEEREMLLEMPAVAELIGEAVAAEREECARLAEGCSITIRESDLDDTYRGDDIRGHVSGKEIADAIRSR
jgi:hypothetical protein